MNNNMDSNPASQPQNSANQLEVIDLREYWHALVLHKKLIAFATAAVIALTLLVTLLLRPMYTATQTLEINTQGRSLVKFQNIEDSSVMADEFLLTQAEILQSDAVAEKVVRELDLINEPEFNGELTQRGLKSGIKSVLSVFTSDEETDEDQMVRRAVDAYKSRLSITPVRKSSLMRVNFESFSPELAAKIANAHGLAYIQLSDSRRFNSTSGAKQFLEQEIEDVQAKLESSEKNLTDFARRYGVVDVEDRNNIITGRLDELNLSLAQAQNSRIQAESKYQQSMNANPQDLAAVFNDELIKTLSAEYVKTRAEYLEASKVYKSDYPLMQQLQAKSDEIQNSISLQAERIKSGLKHEYDQYLYAEQKLNEEIDNLNNQLLDLQDRAVTYNILKREWEADKELYAGLLDRTKEVGVAAGMELNIAQVVDTAKTPKEASSPNLPLNLVLAAVLGSMLGVGLTLLLHVLDRTINNPKSLEELTGLGHLGLVPLIDEDSVEQNSSFVSPDTMSLKMPGSDYSEAVQSVRTSLAFASAGGLPKSLMITSSEPGEGKSTLAMNLALSFALSGKKVMYLESDIRRSRQAKTFGLPSAPGLSDYLAGQSELMVHEEVGGAQNLSLVVAGSLSPNTVDLLSSEHMKSLVAELEESYDLVIIDSPPVIGLADALILTQYAKSTVFVVAAHQTSKDSVENSLARLKSVKAPVVGTVLNKFDHEVAGYSYVQYSYGYESN